MEPVTGDNALERGLHVLERLNDPEIVEAYKRYMQRLEELVGPDQLDTYASIYQRTRRQLEQQAPDTNLTPEEQAVRAKVAADPEVQRLFNQYLELAKAHGLMDPEVDHHRPTTQGD